MEDDQFGRAGKETRMVVKMIGVALVLMFGLANWAGAADTTSDVAKQIREARDTIAAFKKGIRASPAFSPPPSHMPSSRLSRKGRSGSAEPAARASSSRRAKRPAK